MSRRITLGIVLALVLCGLEAAIGLLPHRSETTLATFPPGSSVGGLAWNPDSTEILAAVNMETSIGGDGCSVRLLTVDLSGGITFLTEEVSEASCLGLSWAPSGERVVASRQLGDVGRLLREGAKLPAPEYTTVVLFDWHEDFDTDPTETMLTSANWGRSVAAHGLLHRPLQRRGYNNLL